MCMSSLYVLRLPEGAACMQWLFSYMIYEVKICIMWL